MRRQDPGRSHRRTPEAPAAERGPQVEEQAVLVTYALPRHPRATTVRRDVDALADSVGLAIEREHLGDLDGVQTRPGSLTLFAYGSDAERLWGTLEPIVSRFPHRPARVLVRYGWFGSPARTVDL